MKSREVALHSLAAPSLAIGRLHGAIARPAHALSLTRPVRERDKNTPSAEASTYCFLEKPTVIIRRGLFSTSRRFIFDLMNESRRPQVRASRRPYRRLPASKFDRCNFQHATRQFSVARRCHAPRQFLGAQEVVVRGHFRLILIAMTSTAAYTLSRMDKCPTGINQGSIGTNTRGNFSVCGDILAAANGWIIVSLRRLMKSLETDMYTILRKYWQHQVTDRLNSYNYSTMILNDI